MRCIFWIPYWPNYIYWWTPRMLRVCWKSTICCPHDKIFWFLWMDENHLLVYLTLSMIMPYLFLYLKLVLLKLYSYGLQVNPKLSKYLENMTYFHKILNTSINLNTKWAENCYKSCDLNVLTSWYIDIMQFVCIGGKVGGNVLKCCGILIYQKITIPYNFWDIQANHDPWWDFKWFFYHF
jgi:hypothetical protein